MNTHMYAFMHTHIHTTYIHTTCMHMCTHTPHACTRAHTHHMHAHVHTHTTHTHTHTYKMSSVPHFQFTAQNTHILVLLFPKMWCIVALKNRRWGEAQRGGGGDTKGRKNLQGMKELAVREGKRGR